MNTQIYSKSQNSISTKKNLIMALVVLCPFILLPIIFSTLGPSSKAFPTKKYVSVYEKLIDGAPVNILVVGDSISAGAGSTKGHSWAVQIPELIKTTYGSECHLTNLSIGGTTSVAGIVKEEMLDDGVNYDLVIICYGENDVDDATFSSSYEGIIRSSQSKYPGCSIICVIESSQREYTSKINTIINIAQFHNIPIADTIKAFAESGYKYEDLVNAPDDLTHPNDKGHEIYLNTIANVISNQMNVNTVYTTDTHQFDTTVFYSKSDFKKIDNKTFSLSLDNPVAAKISVYSTRIPGENGIRVFADDSVVYESSYEWSFDIQQEYIETLTDSPVCINKNLLIEFPSKETAKGFVGILLSDF